MSGLRRREEGQVIVAALAILLTIALLGAAALSFSLRSIHTSSSDRYSDLAIAAADEGADLVGWRMNKLLVSPGGANLMGFTGGLLASLGCVDSSLSVTEVAVANVEVNGAYQPSSCFTSGTTPEDAGNHAYFYYNIETDNNLTLVNGSLVQSNVERRVIVVGDALGEYRRVLVTYKLQNGVFERYRYIECSDGTSVTFSSSGAVSGCPDPGP